MEDIADMFAFRCNLMDEIRNYPCIYDKAHVDHYKRNKKQEIYDIIGTALGVTGTIILFSIRTCGKNQKVNNYKPIIN